MSTINSEAVLFAAVYKGLEAESIHPCKIMAQYNVFDDRWAVRVEYVPTKVAVTHHVNAEDLRNPPRLAQELVAPLVLKMLEVLTS